VNALNAVTKGLWNLPPEQRREVYEDLRQVHGLSPGEPVLPLPGPAFDAWCQRFAGMLAARMAQHPLTRSLANPAVMEQSIRVYGRPADEAFFESHAAMGARTFQTGLPGLYVHAFLNVIALPLALQAAREVLSPEHVALLEKRYPGAMLLRHALMQEAVLGMGGMNPAA
jgi:hypothetical protein